MSPCHGLGAGLWPKRKRLGKPCPHCRPPSTTLCMIIIFAICRLMLWSLSRAINKSISSSSSCGSMNLVGPMGQVVAVVWQAAMGRGGPNGDLIFTRAREQALLGNKMFLWLLWPGSHFYCHMHL